MAGSASLFLSGSLTSWPDFSGSSREGESFFKPPTESSSSSSNSESSSSSSGLKRKWQQESRYESTPQTNLENRNDFLERTIHELIAKNNELKKRLESENQNSSNKITGLNSQISFLTTENIELLEENKRLEEENQEMSSTINGLNAKVEGLSKSVLRGDREEDNIFASSSLEIENELSNLEHEEAL